MIIKFNGKEFEMLYSFKSYLYYENITGKSFVPEDLNKMTNITVLFFSFCLSTFNKHGENFKLTYDEFIDFIDENGGEVFILEFVNWFIKEMEIHSQLLNKKDDEPLKGKKKVKKS